MARSFHIPLRREFLPFGPIMRLEPKKSSLPVTPQALAETRNSWFSITLPEKQPPMFFPRFRPFSQHHKNLSTFHSQTPGQLGEAKVVADNDTDLAQMGIGHSQESPVKRGLHSSGKEVDLAVLSGQLALIHHICRIADLFSVRLRRTSHQHHAIFR